MAFQGTPNARRRKCHFFESRSTNERLVGRMADPTENGTRECYTFRILFIEQGAEDRRVQVETVRHQVSSMAPVDSFPYSLTTLTAIRPQPRTKKTREVSCDRNSLGPTSLLRAASRFGAFKKSKTNFPPKVGSELVSHCIPRNEHRPIPLLAHGQNPQGT